MLPRTASGGVPSRDADGFLFYQGRNDSIIKTKGYRVSPVEIEDALRERQQLRVLAHKLKSNGDGLPRQPRRARWREGARWRSTMAVVKQLFVKPWFYAEGLKSC